MGDGEGEETSRPPLQICDTGVKKKKGGNTTNREDKSKAHPGAKTGLEHAKDQAQRGASSVRDGGG